MIVRVDISKVAAEVLKRVPKKGIAKVVRRALGAAAEQYWKQLAQSDLKSTSRDYAAGIQYEEKGDQVTITLNGMMPNMVENGFSGGDMRRWLLSGPNAKRGKDGKMYNTVPFRHGTPGTGGRNVGRVMPGAIHTVAKKLAATQSAMGRVQYGGRLHPGLPMKMSTQQLLTHREKPWHSTSIYMGMIREAKVFSSGKEQTTGYTTFRRISEKSSGTQHWIHPGIKARHFAKRVQAHVESLANEIVMGSLE